MRDGICGGGGREIGRRQGRRFRDGRRLRRGRRRQGQAGRRLNGLALAPEEQPRRARPQEGPERARVHGDDLVLHHVVHRRPARQRQRPLARERRMDQQYAVAAGVDDVVLGVVHGTPAYWYSPRSSSTLRCGSPKKTDFQPSGCSRTARDGAPLAVYSASTVAWGSLTAIGRVDDLVLSDFPVVPQPLRDRVPHFGDLAAQAGVPGLEAQDHPDQFAAFLGRRALLVEQGGRVQPGQRLAGPLQLLPDRQPLRRRHAQGVQEQVQFGVGEAVWVTSLCR